MRVDRRRALSRALRDSDAGLSLAEMVVAMGIILSVFVAAGGVFIRSSQGQRSAEAIDRATQLANDSVEQFTRIPWSKVGFYTDQSPVDCTNAASGCAYNEKTVIVGPNAPTYGTDPNPPFVPVPTKQFVQLQTFTIRTDITWQSVTFAAGDTNNDANGLGYAPGGVAQPYAPKRIRVTVSYVLGKARKQVISETTRSPSSAEVIPPTIGTGSGTGCTLTAPFCVTYATEGQVLQNTAGFPTSRAVQFFVSTTRKADNGSVALPGGTKAMSSSDGYTWTYLVPPNNGGILAPGHRTITFTFNVGGNTYSSKLDVDWNIPVSAGAPLTVYNRGLYLFGNLGVLGTGTPYLCVNKNNNELYRDSTFFVDVANSDPQDSSSPQPPTIDWTAPTNGPIPMSQSNVFMPSASLVPPSGTGSLGTTRWGYTFKAKSLFNRTHTTVTVTVRRPADGQTATLIQPIGVVFASNINACSSASTPRSDATDPIQ